ncbi:hypothetical protein [Aliiglaciecola sp. M165]|uniref:hypothetical protein n=1 Tax=Aliiglaciecola sp. M165 TaxID=2593649 RepID=UPI00118015D8|nr:hypothetical protein [Aliiglaciecola sp. M165]TRY28752.1 hypothetical protein FM019_20510 [Aliiglaciecola sp. M165]
MSNFKLLSFLFLVFVGDALACSVPKPGYGYSLEDLIDKSDNIVIVELSKKKVGEPFIVYDLKVIEVLKGEPATEFEFFGHTEKHESATYTDHNDAVFWFTQAGRSEWPCCICGPDHTFEKGFKYLFFPDLLGATKSAEIINSEDDLWLNFVVNRIK